MSQARDFIWIHKKYKGKWIALTLDEKTVIASGDSLKKILQDAKKKGIDHPVVMKIPQAVVPLVGTQELAADSYAF